MKKRQGDVLFIKTDRIPENLVIKGDNIVAEGKVSDHKHMLMDGVLYQDEKGDLFVNVDTGIATVTHEEHKSITLPAGNYKVIKQREYEPMLWRSVRD